VPELVAALRPVRVPSQLIHGDLTGNVLFDDAQPPAIIDFSPYWRPPAYASAIVAADALVWERADRQVLDAVAHISDFGQYLVRALIFRSVTDWIVSQEDPANSAVEDDGPGPVPQPRLPARGPPRFLGCVASSEANPSHISPRGWKGRAEASCVDRPEPF